MSAVSEIQNRSRAYLTFSCEKRIFKTNSMKMYVWCVQELQAARRLY
jgi:hypothetical protein